MSPVSPLTVYSLRFIYTFVLSFSIKVKINSRRVVLSKETVEMTLKRIRRLSISSKPLSALFSCGGNSSSSRRLWAALPSLCDAGRASVREGVLTHVFCGHSTPACLYGGHKGHWRCKLTVLSSTPPLDDRNNEIIHLRPGALNRWPKGEDLRAEVH